MPTYNIFNLKYIWIFFLEYANVEKTTSFCFINEIWLWIISFSHYYVYYLNFGLWALSASKCFTNTSDQIDILVKFAQPYLSLGPWMHAQWRALNTIIISFISQLCFPQKEGRTRHCVHSTWRDSETAASLTTSGRTACAMGIETWLFQLLPHRAQWQLGSTKDFMPIGNER